MSEIPNGRRTGDHPSRWRALFSPQATSLLLVVAVLLLAYVTIQSKSAAESARTTAITNQRIIVEQDTAGRLAEVRARQQAVAAAVLAKDTAKSLLIQVTASNSTRDAALTALILRMEQNLADAISNLDLAIQRLQASLNRQAAHDRDPSPSPSPSCTSPALLCALH